MSKGKLLNAYVVFMNGEVAQGHETVMFSNPVWFLRIKIGSDLFER